MSTPPNIRACGRKNLTIKLVLAALLLTPFAAAKANWKFIVTSDSRGTYGPVNSVALAELASETSNQNVDFLLFLGDLVNGTSNLSPEQFHAQLSTWVEVMKPVYDAQIPVYVCRGNHEIADNWTGSPLPPDLPDSHAVRWLRVFGNDAYPLRMLPANGPAQEQYMTYAVAHKNALIIVLDQYDGIGHAPVHRINLNWLQEQLAPNTKPHIFVGAHEPAFMALHLDCLDNHPAERDAMWAAIKNAGGRTYFCGHDHFYDHARINDGDHDPNNDIHQYIIGTSGAPFYTWSPPYPGDNSHYTPQQQHHARKYGYVLVEVNDLDVTLVWIERESNDLTEPGTYSPAETWRYTVAPKPILLWPNGRELLVAGQTRTITWKTIDGAQTQYVVIDFSHDAGASWQRIATCRNTGACQWLLPALDSDRCLLRITDLQHPALADITDDAFTIFRCQIPLEADVNHDCYVDFTDYALLLEQWLKCGNPFDPACRPQ